MELRSAENKWINKCMDNHSLREWPLHIRKWLIYVWVHVSMVSMLNSVIASRTNNNTITTVTLSWMATIHSNEWSTNTLGSCGSANEIYIYTRSDTADTCRMKTHTHTQIVQLRTKKKRDQWHTWREEWQTSAEKIVAAFAANEISIANKNIS